MAEIELVITIAKIVLDGLIISNAVFFEQVYV